jgi:hypothetical protein
MLREERRKRIFMALSFAKDILPMFRVTDLDTMQNYGLDLSSYDEVKNKVQAIYATLAGRNHALRWSMAKGPRCHSQTLDG